MSSTEPPALLVRTVEDADAEAVARVLVRSRRAAAPAMPLPVHPDEEAPAYVRRRLAEARGWVAEVDDDVVGFALVDPGWLDMLYVLPDHAGAGVGTTLLDVVKHDQPGGFALWVFESNEPARRFYRRRGLVELERTDGSGNEEREPDVRMAWPGREPMAYLRAQVDDVDRELAAVIARRVALTTEIQRHKEVPGHAGRDEDREAEIATRMARRSPVLTAQEWRRIVHEVITVSLDAAARADD